MKVEDLCHTHKSYFFCWVHGARGLRHLGAFGHMGVPGCMHIEAIHAAWGYCRVV